MSNITYRKYPNALSACIYDVFLDGKRVGEIQTHRGGYRYAAIYESGGYNYGETYSTIADVKASIEGRPINMKVKDLIAQLSDCDPDSEVVINVPRAGNSNFAGVSMFVRECFSVAGKHPVIITDATCEDLNMEG
jgi:hypothetical protein